MDADRLARKRAQRARALLVVPPPPPPPKRNLKIPPLPPMVAEAARDEAAAARSLGYDAAVEIATRGPPVHELRRDELTFTVPEAPEPEAEPEDAPTGPARRREAPPKATIPAATPERGWFVCLGSCAGKAVYVGFGWERKTPPCPHCGARTQQATHGDVYPEER